MVHKINQKILTLDDYGKDNFIKELKRLGDQNNLFDKRNKEWFQILPHSFDKKYIDWFFLFDGEKPMAFSTIQKYYSGCYRVLTRTYIYRDYRRFTNPKLDTFLSPTMRLLPYQLEYLTGYDTVFVSMQSSNRRDALIRFKTKIEYHTGDKWHLSRDMLQTCVGGKDCWQNVIYKGSPPILNSMSIEKYDRMFN
jgi:hypothetical protein